MRRAAAIALLSGLFMHTPEAGGKGGETLHIVRQLVDCSEQCYRRLSEDFSGGAIRTLEASGKKMSFDEFYAYGYLAEKGMPADAIALTDSDDAVLLARGFIRKMWPREFMGKFTRPDGLVEYSRRAAESDPDFLKGREWTAMHLRKRLSRREHFSRIGTDYEEDARQLYSVNSVHMLFLLKTYLDYFESSKAKEQVPELFDGISESGGLIFSEGGNMTFLKIPNDIEYLEANKYDATGWYQTPAIEHYIPNLGLLHTHPFYEPGQAHIYAGPSGFAKYDRSADAYIGDTGILRQTSRINPYAMDVVVTMIDKSYNVDAYFSDVYTKNGRATAEKNVIVIDLGLYNY